MNKIGSLLILGVLMLSSMLSFADEVGKGDVVLTSSNEKEIYYNQEVIQSDVKAQMIDGIVMIPLRSTLEKMGYEVKWINETKTVEISQGAQWTSIKVDENAYFKNKMAAFPLSAAPTLVKDRILVPVEFFSVIFNKGLTVEEGQLFFNDYEVAIHSGYVKEKSVDENGVISVTLTSDMSSEDVMLQTIIHMSNSSTFFNKKVVEGEYINVISSMMMTMSIPGQTSGYVVY